MLELIAQGEAADYRWRRVLPEEGKFELGRTTSAFRVPWDNQVSRRHVEIKVKNGLLIVSKLSTASNPVFFMGDEVSDFELRVGEHFVIGKTTFTLAADRAFATLDAPNPISQKTFSPEFLRQVSYRDADRRIEILNRLPATVSSASNTEDLLDRLTNLIMAGVPRATSVAVVAIQEDGSVTDSEAGRDASIDVIHWDRTGVDGGDFQPSGRLIRDSVETQESILHVWSQRKRESSEYTIDFDNDWAFVCPMNSVATPSWGVYVTGTNRGGSSLASTDQEQDLQGDIKFCELVSSTVRNLMLVREFERRNSSLRMFFSPVVMDALTGPESVDALKPKSCDLSVMFCDLRGFSRTSEQMSDRLFELLSRVSDSLGIVTNEILNHSGVIGDFHGDSVMGFWGWPIEPEDPSENATQTLLAAMNVRRVFEETRAANPNFQDFHIGIGVASGTAVAGKIGSRDQVKVTAFGPVVNLAARLEGMTRQTGSAVLIDKATADRIAASLVADQFHLRRLGNCRPYGLETPVEIYELLEPGELADRDVTLYQQALLQFESGDLQGAWGQLQEINEEDNAKRFLGSYVQQQIEAGREGDGIISLSDK